jgi:uncharacterized membrane protein YccC
LVTRQQPDTLLMRLVVLLLAAGDAALIRGVLLAERPQTELNRLRRAVHAGIDRVLRHIAAAIGAGAWTEEARAALHRDTYRLGDIIMLAQARVAALEVELPDLGSRWLHLLAIELTTERAARTALHDLGTPADRAELLATIQALRSGAAAPPQCSTAPLAAALDEAPRNATPPFAGPAPTTAAPGLRPAVQTAIAAAFAIIGGALVSPNRRYWAAIAAYVMFQGTRSRGESVAKGLQFMIGTLAGVLIGMLVATLLSGHEIVTMAAIVVAVFLAFQTNLAALGVMMFWITIILGLMFGVLGYFPPELLSLRLKETAAGAACGVVVAILVLVRRGYAATFEATTAFLRALGQSVDSAARVLLDNQPEPELAAHILVAEQRFRDLNAVAQSEQSNHPMTRNEELLRRMLLLEACEEWARELGQLCLQRAHLGGPALARLVRQTVVRIDASLSGQIDRLANQAAETLTAGEPAEDPGQSMQDGSARRAARLVLRIDAALLRMATR